MHFRPPSPRKLAASDQTLRWQILLPLLLAIGLITTGSLVSMNLLSVGRAYAQAQGRWSLARAEACHSLSRYAQMGDISDLMEFDRAMDVIDHHNQARDLIASDEFDPQAAAAHLLHAGSSPVDVDDMVHMLRKLQHTWMAQGALKGWIESDPPLRQLRQIATVMRQANPQERQARQTAWVEDIERLENRLRALERDSAEALARAMRQLHDGAAIGLMIVSSLLSLGCLVLVRRAVQRHTTQQHDLNMAHERIALAVDSAGLGLFEYELATQTYYLDSRAAAAHGLPREPRIIAHRNLCMQVVTEDRARALSGMGSGLAAEGIHSVRYEVLTPTGMRRHLEITGRLSPDGARIIGTTRDVTEEVRGVHMAAQRDAAQQVATAQRTFLSRLSHELRTPLNAMLGFAQVLRRDLGPGEAHARQNRQVDLILQAGRQLLVLIDDVLDLSKVEAGDIGVQLQPTDTRAILDQCLPLIEDLAERRRVDVSVQAPPQLPRTLADPHRLHQVFLNLLSNGCKYNREGGRLLATLSADDRQLVAEITDTGPGMTPEEVAGLFRPFHRVASTARQAEGTGLGLYIVRQLMERMGGTVEAHSEPGRGTTFRITLPLAEATQASPAGNPAPEVATVA